jgi:putative endonuclease
MGTLLHLALRILQVLQRVTPMRATKHLRTGRKGEASAYLLLRAKGYRIVATNFRAQHHHGEIDVIAWDGDVLCFIEVKTRIGEGLTPPEAAVDVAKKAHIRAVARLYLRRFSGERRPDCRFDIVSVCYPRADLNPESKLFKGAFHWRSRRSGSTGHVRDCPRGRSWNPLR